LHQQREKCKWLLPLNLFTTTTTTATKAFDRNPTNSCISFLVQNRTDPKIPSHSSAFKGSLLSTLVLRKQKKTNRNDNTLRDNKTEIQFKPNGRVDKHWQLCCSRRSNLFQIQRTLHTKLTVQHTLTQYNFNNYVTEFW
jgi:hypothetical protein